MGNPISKQVFPAPESHYSMHDLEMAGWEVHALQSDRRGRSHVVWAAALRRSAHPSCVIVYSHGNMEDLTTNLRRLEEFACALDADVLTYEYTGYGPRGEIRQSERASERDLRLDAETVARWVARTYSDVPIVFYGRSLGTAAALHGANAADGHASGVVLEAPFTSIIVARLPAALTMALRPLDMLNNLREASQLAYGT